MRRSPLRKKSNTYWRKKCVEIAKTQAKERDNWTCQHCGRTKAQGWQMQGSHILPEGTYVSMSADIDNILCLCVACHTGGSFLRGKSWHGDPLYFAEWFNEKYPGKHQELRERAQKQKIINWEKRYYELKQLYELQTQNSNLSPHVALGPRI